MKSTDLDTALPDNVNSDKSRKNSEPGIEKNREPKIWKVSLLFSVNIQNKFVTVIAYFIYVDNEERKKYGSRPETLAKIFRCILNSLARKVIPEFLFFFKV